MPQYLIDSNVLSEPMQAAPQPEILEWLADNLDQSRICSIVWFELKLGVELLPAGTRKTKLEAYLADLASSRGFQLLGYTQSAAELHAKEFARLQKIGRTPPFSDTQIAAIAVVNNLTLATLNRKDFANFKGLKVKSW